MRIFCGHRGEARPSRALESSLGECPSFAQAAVELGEGVLNGVEGRAVGGQKLEAATPRLDLLARFFDCMDR